jgi:hypothetical protein
LARVVLAVLCMDAQAQEQSPMTVTTDTPQYCAQLVQQIAQRHSSLPDVARLLSEGRELCEQGEVRTGLRHLRRAEIILNHQAPPPAPAAQRPQ